MTKTPLWAVGIVFPIVVLLLASFLWGAEPAPSQNPPELPLDALITARNTLQIQMNQLVEAFKRVDAATKSIDAEIERRQKMEPKTEDTKTGK